jgi:hypothetical protein
LTILDAFLVPLILFAAVSFHPESLHVEHLIDFTDVLP